MFDVGLPEFFVLGVVALLVFGPERLPEVAVQAARLIRRLRGMAESARNDLTADLEPHMRELRELRELDPRKMAKRYVLDPVDEDGTLAELRGDGLRRSLGGAKGSKKGKKGGVPAASAPGAGEPAAGAGAVTASGANGSASAPATALTASTSPAAEGPASDGPAVPPAMAPAVTPSGQRPPYDLDAT